MVCNSIVISFDLFSVNNTTNNKTITHLSLVCVRYQQLGRSVDGCVNQLHLACLHTLSQHFVPIFIIIRVFWALIVQYIVLMNNVQSCMQAFAVGTLEIHSFANYLT